MVNLGGDVMVYIVRKHCVGVVGCLGYWYG